MAATALAALALACATLLLPAPPPLLARPEVWGLLGLCIGVKLGLRGLLAAAPACLAIMQVAWHDEQRLHAALIGQDLLVEGTVCGFPRAAADAQRFEFHIRPDALAAGLPSRLRLSWYEAPAEIEAGQVLRLKVRLRQGRGLSNPGAFDYERWLLTRRIGATGYVRPSSWNQLTSERIASCPLLRWRAAFAHKLERLLRGHEMTPFVLALTVGARHRLTAADWDILRRVGLAHLMAISGLHVGLVAGFCLALGRCGGRLLLLNGYAPPPLTTGRVCAVTGAAVYAGMAGFSVPTLRALATVAVLACLAGARRGGSFGAALAAALLVVLMIEPLAPIRPDFWLSFIAVGFLTLGTLALPVASPGQESASVPQALVRLLRVQTTLSVALAPLTLALFAEISLVSPVVNLVVVPLFAAGVVPLTLVGSLTALVSEPAGAILLGLAAEALGILLGGLATVAGSEASTWAGVPQSRELTAAALAACVLAVWPRPAGGRGAALIIVLALLVRTPAPPAHGNLRVVVMDVGQGLAVLIQSAEHSLLYDAGPAYRTGDAGRSVVVPVLRHFGVRDLDIMLISHGDADHLGGAASVIGRYPEADLLATARFGLAGVAMLTCRAGLRWRWDGIRFRVLHPQPRGRAAAGPRNDRSCVLLVERDEFSLLLPGDIERRAELRLVRDGLLQKMDLVVAPHHGSATSSSRVFVDAARPTYVVFSAGYANRWGFPRPEIQARWLQVGACPLNTGDSGAIVFETDHTGRLSLRYRYRERFRRLWRAAPRDQRPCSPIGGAPVN
jgi:competence protein ComEC